MVKNQFLESLINNFIHKKACVLMNNIQQTRVQLEKTYHAMGGKELEDCTADMLNQLQSRLNSQILDEMAKIFATRLTLINLFLLTFEQLSLKYLIFLQLHSPC